MPILLALGVFAATVAVYAPSFGNGFVNWDDEANFVRNEEYRGLSPSHLAWMFTTFHMGHYQPLAWMTLGADYAVHGEGAGGGGSAAGEEVGQGGNRIRPGGCRGAREKGGRQREHH